MRNPGFLMISGGIEVNPIFSFYTPWTRHKTKGFLTFSGGIQMDIWLKWVNELAKISLILKRNLETIPLL